jgi:uroporphyrin-III C-methyltransferase
MAIYTALLTATKAESHVHLVVGSNSMAAARCSQSLAAGASPVLLTPGATKLHYALQKRVDDGQVKWVREAFQDSHLFTLGRKDVDHIVDAVFVTSDSRDHHLGMLPRVNKLRFRS